MLFSFFLLFGVILVSARRKAAETSAITHATRGVQVSQLLACYVLDQALVEGTHAWAPGDPCRKYTLHYPRITVHEATTAYCTLPKAMASKLMLLGSVSAYEWSLSPEGELNCDQTLFNDAWLCASLEQQQGNLPPPPPPHPVFVD